MKRNLDAILQWRSRNFLRIFWRSIWCRLSHCAGIFIRRPATTRPEFFFENKKWQKCFARPLFFDVKVFDVKIHYKAGCTRQYGVFFSKWVFLTHSVCCEIFPILGTIDHRYTRQIACRGIGPKLEGNLGYFVVKLFALNIVSYRFPLGRIRIRSITVFSHRSRLLWNFDFVCKIYNPFHWVKSRSWNCI